jgi:lipopolysaccharide transport system permease protein
MLVFSFVFGKMAQLPSGGVAYPVMVFVAMLPWQLFSSGLSEASNSLVTNANMVSKIYFPRLIVPTSAVIVCFVDFLISIAILAGMMVWYQVMPNWRLVFLPLFTALALITCLGASLWLSALTVKFRDFRHVIPFIVQFGLYLSPVGFSSDVVRNKFGDTAFRIFSLNPMVGVIDGFRWAVTGTATSVLDWTGLAISVAVVTVLTVTGLKYFRATEETFADII